ncbi:hypothetical protein B0H14DRAFT_2633266 [Mycena olivaceomarginata]|nr:hypothetical protein B0H14DRAFT_2633266 [Mycena olivaceomarginata]
MVRLVVESRRGPHQQIHKPGDDQNERLEKTSDTVEWAHPLSGGRASSKRTSQEMIRAVTPQASRSHEKFLDLESPSHEEAVEQDMPVAVMPPQDDLDKIIGPRMHPVNSTTVLAAPDSDSRSRFGDIGCHVNAKQCHLFITRLLPRATMFHSPPGFALACKILLGVLPHFDCASVRGDLHFDEAAAAEGIEGGEGRTAASGCCIPTSHPAFRGHFFGAEQSQGFWGDLLTWDSPNGRQVISGKLAVQNLERGHFDRGMKSEMGIRGCWIITPAGLSHGREERM